jgi:hypothetical protein
MTQGCTWTQIGMFRPIRMDHTNCLQVAIKTLQFNTSPGSGRTDSYLQVMTDYRCSDEIREDL